MGLWDSWHCGEGSKKKWVCGTAGIVGRDLEKWVCGTAGICGRGSGAKMGLWDGWHCREGSERNGSVGQLAL